MDMKSHHQLSGGDILRLCPLNFAASLVVIVDISGVGGDVGTVDKKIIVGDPIVFELRGYRLCLRLKEAASIRVRPLSSR